MKKKVALFLVFILAAALGCSCAWNGGLPAQEGQIQELDRLWIPENGEYVPFLVLKKTERDYLLIREHTTGPSAFVYGDSPNSYYGHSALDDYLNTEYASRFSSEVQAYLVESEVVITRESSIGVCGEEMETIRRIFYVPSWTEATGMHNSIGPEEGSLFSREFMQRCLVATNDQGEPAAWWLRTPDTWHFNRVFGISEYGSTFTGTTVDSITVYKAGVRPVFRVSSAMPVALENGQWRMRVNTE
ncbi:MAG: DUF6273 domain-containing protein [Aristaeellaceae bacterium]